MFKSYQHIERWNSVDCEGLLDNDNLYIQAKVDSTNCSVWYDGGVRAGSRKREVTPEKDNAGFANWVLNSEDTEPVLLRKFVTENPNLRIYGEWMGATKFLGQIKDYTQEAKNHMYIFDVFDDDTGVYLDPADWQDMLTAYGLDPYFVKILAIVDKPTIETIAEIAQNNKFLLDNANHPGEGVVIKCYSWRNKYGRQQFGKLVLDEYKQAKKVSKKAVLNPGEIEMTIVDTYVTDAEISKAVAKICLINEVDAFDNKNPKLVGMLLSYMWKDFLEENIVDICKKFRAPIIDFGKLKGICNAKVRKYIKL